QQVRAGPDPQQPGRDQIAEAGTSISMPSASEQSKAPAAPRCRLVSPGGSTVSAATAAPPNPAGRAVSWSPILTALPGSTCGISTRGPNSVRYPKNAPDRASPTRPERSSAAGISGNLARSSRIVNRQPASTAVPARSLTGNSGAGGEEARRRAASDP